MWRHIFGYLSLVYVVWCRPDCIIDFKIIAFHVDYKPFKKIWKFISCRWIILIGVWISNPLSFGTQWSWKDYNVEFGHWSNWKRFWGCKVLWKIYRHGLRWYTIIYRNMCSKRCSLWWINSGRTSLLLCLNERVSGSWIDKSSLTHYKSMCVVRWEK